MWKTLYQSVQGTSHVQAGQPCQDSCAALEIETADETVLVLASSDGAGSAPFSEIGSRMACQTLVDVVAAEIRAAGRLNTVGTERAVAWFEQVHKAIGVQAALREVDGRQLACTLLFAVLGQSGAAFGQVGDGAIVVWRGESYETVFWPQSGEYVNTTNFVTDPRYESFVEFDWRDAQVDEAALFSDGLQMLGLDYRAKRAHDPFFAPMFQSLRREPDPGKLMEPLRAFLESPQLAERTDDDKTLILATRLSC
jgi:Protein phosphatase 2C